MRSRISPFHRYRAHRRQSGQPQSTRGPRTYTDSVQGNILISETGIARLGDFGIRGVITVPLMVPRSTKKIIEPVLPQYTAPELLNPWQFNRLNSNPTKESDIYSLAVTAYEVCFVSRSCAITADIVAFSYQVLTGALLCGTPCGGIISCVVTGNQPPRPDDRRWLPYQVWVMITKCWSEQPNLRWDIRSVYKLLASSIQETGEGQQDDKPHFGETTPFPEVRTDEPTLILPEDLPPLKAVPARSRLRIPVEGNLGIYCSKSNHAHFHNTFRARPFIPPKSSYPINRKQIDRGSRPCSV